MSFRLIETLAVCASAAFGGAMLLIGLVFVPYWSSMPAADFLAWFGAHSHLIGRAIPVFALPAALATIASLWLARQDARARLLWGLSFGCLAGVFAITMLYHLPTNARFVAGTVWPEEVAVALEGWLRWHVVRVALGLLAAALGITAVTSRAAVESTPAQRRSSAAA
jgi:hypothetical protein